MSIIGTRPPLISETNLYELHHGKSKKVDYEGSIENFEKAMQTIEKTIFK